MVWEVKNDSQQTCDGEVCSQTSGVKVVGWFREQQQNSPWVRLYSRGSTNTGLRMLYTGV
ncbi:hypothetical protein CFPU101_48730 [Chroococcus sp. FPU101]|nr:hypothetical protein CFPU101_48730 [Chroococcus sp. FPU101]